MRKKNVIFKIPENSCGFETALKGRLTIGALEFEDEKTELATLEELISPIEGAARSRGGRDCSWWLRTVVLFQISEKLKKIKKLKK